MIRKPEQDPCLFVRRIGKRNQYFLSWVAGILVFTNEDTEASEIESSSGKFLQKDSQDLSKKIAISHEGYISKLLKNGI